MIVNFGRRVRALRLAANISQPELGLLSRVGAKFIGQIERGESNPSLESMVLVADALGYHVADMCQRENAPPYVALTAENVRRAQDALVVLSSVLKTRKQTRKR